MRLRRLLKFKAGLQGFKGHAIADMTESCVIEVETQCIGWALLWSVQPKDLSLRINEASNQPGASQAVDPWAFTRCPDTTLIIAKAQRRDWLVVAMRLIRRQRSADRCLKLLQRQVDLLLRLA